MVNVYFVLTCLSKHKAYILELFQDCSCHLKNSINQNSPDPCMLYCTVQAVASPDNKIAKPHRYIKGDDVCIFLERFAEFVTLSRLEQINLDLTLLSLVQDDKLYRKLKSVTVSLSAEQKTDVVAFVAAIKSALFPATETRIMRSALSTMRQDAGESVDDFALRITEKATRA